MWGPVLRGGTGCEAQTGGFSRVVVDDDGAGRPRTVAASPLCEESHRGGMTAE